MSKEARPGAPPLDPAGAAGPRPLNFYTGTLKGLRPKINKVFFASFLFTKKKTLASYV